MSEEDWDVLLDRKNSAKDRALVELLESLAPKGSPRTRSAGDAPKEAAKKIKVTGAAAKAKGAKKA